jgi:TP901 family phage tail tape measure protein
MISAEGLGYTFIANDLASGPISRLNANVKGLATTSTAAQVAYNKNMALIKAGTKSLLIGGIGLLAINSLTKSYGKFEMKLASAGAVMNATAGEMAKLEDAAIKAGIATQFDPGEAAQGLENLGAAGMNAKEAIATLNPVLDLAAASLGQLGVAESAANVAGVLNAFGDSTDFASKRVDQLVRITQMSNFQARDFSIAISQAAAQAASADQTFESMTATLGMLRNTNLDASSSATAYREAVRRLASDKRSLKKLTELGVDSVNRETGKIKDLGKVMAELIPQVEKLGAQEKNLALKRIFGVRGMKTYNAFFMSYKKAVKEGKAEIGDFATVHERLVTGLDNAGGAAARTREKLLATAEGQRILMKGSIETFKVVAGKALVPAALPALKSMISAINALIKVVNLIPAPMRGFLSHFVGVGAAMLAFSGLLKVIVGMKGLMGLQAATAATTVATERLTFAQARQNVVMAKGQGIRARTTAQIGLMKSSLAGTLPFIGLAVAGVMGYFSMLDEREKKEKKRLQEVKETQRRMRAEYARTAGAVESIGRAAAGTVGKLIKLSRTKELLQVQETIRKNLTKAENAEEKFLANSIKLHTGNLSKKKKAEARALGLKLKQEMDAARRIVEVYKHGELQIRANMLKRIPAGRRTEAQNRVIVAASQARIQEMTRKEGDLLGKIDRAKKNKQVESVKKFEGDLAKLRKQRDRETLRAGRLAGFRGRGVAGARKAVGEFAEPVAAKTRKFGRRQKPPGMDQAVWERILADPAAIGGAMGLVGSKQQQFIRGIEKEQGIIDPTLLRGVSPTKVKTAPQQMAPTGFFGEEGDQMSRLQRLIIEAQRKGIEQARIQVHIDGEQLQTTNTNKESRTASGKPTAPEGGGTLG